MPMHTDIPHVTFLHDSPQKFMATMKAQSSAKDLWLLGGAKLAQSFCKGELIDEIILTIVPQKMGSGISLGISYDTFTLIEEKALMDGIIQKKISRNLIISMLESTRCNNFFDTLPAIHSMLTNYI